jgi:hypothetical protein
VCNAFSSRVRKSLVEGPTRVNQRKLLLWEMAQPGAFVGSSNEAEIGIQGYVCLFLHLLIKIVTF